MLYMKVICYVPKRNHVSMKSLAVDSQLHNIEVLQYHLRVAQHLIHLVIFLPMSLVRTLLVLAALVDIVAKVLMKCMVDRVETQAEHILDHIHLNNIYHHHDNQHRYSIQDHILYYCSIRDNHLVYLLQQKKRE